jgi:hypothetical protein
MAAALCGCAGGSIGGAGGATGSAGANGTAGSTGSAGATAAAGSTGTAGSTPTAGATGTAGSVGTAGSTGGGAAGTTPTAGTTGAAGIFGAGGTTSTAGQTGQPPPGSPKAVAVANHDLAVDGKGTVFNVADDYFNDGFIPATPVANFGLHAQIIAVPNDDGSLDVAWIDYASGKSSPWNLKTPTPIYVTHVEATLAAATTTASGVSSYKLLGFTRDATDAHYFAYNKDHALKTTTSGDQNNISGNELHITKIANGAPAWDKLIFGDQDNNKDATPGDPGGAASSVLGYDPTNKKLVIYQGHSMMWTPTRHQAGFLRILEPDTGAVIPPAGNDILHFGAGWWYSHNFNQRLIIDGGAYYVLAHGDAYPRQLGLGKWTLAKYMSKNDTDFNESYWAITGNEGDNNTNAQTGQFARLPDGRFVMVHTSSQGRTARDVRIVAADGATGKSNLAGAVWLTSNTGTVNATMAKVEVLGGNLLVTWAQWDSSKKHVLTWMATILDPTFKTLVGAAAIPNVEFVDSAPLFRFKGGPNAGAVGWVSGNATHTLTVHVATATN